MMSGDHSPGYLTSLFQNSHLHKALCVTISIDINLIPSFKSSNSIKRKVVAVEETGRT